jgi:hypothetical protein
MAKRISELPAAAAVADTDELELNQAGTSRKGTRAQLVAGLAAATHLHPLADITDAGALAAKDLVEEGDIASQAVTTAKLADLSVSSAKLALEAVNSNQLADDAVTSLKIADEAITTSKIAAGAVGPTELADNAVVMAKIAAGAVTTNKIAASAVTETQLAADAVTALKIAGGAVGSAKIAAGAVGAVQLADTPVTPGTYAIATVTVDQQGRITAASSGTAGEVNDGVNIGVDGVEVFAGKVGLDLQFRHIAPASNRITVEQNGGDIDIDVVPGSLLIPAGNVIGLAPVATAGTLAALTSLNAGGGALSNYLAAQDTVSGSYTFVQSDSGREKVFTGAAPVTWTIPELDAGTHAVVHNIGTAAITFLADGVTLKGLTTLAADKTAAFSWLPGAVVKLTGELT